MKKVIVFMVMMVVAGTMGVSAKGGVPTVERWEKAGNVRWEMLDRQYAGAKNEDWRDKFPQMVVTVDAEKADQIWEKVSQGKAAFHQENLWMLTSGNDSLVAAMVDVEWAFDAVFVKMMIPRPGGSARGRGNQFAANNVDNQFAQTYNKEVGEKVMVIMNMSGVEYDREAESVRFAEAIKRWSDYGTVRWSDADSTVEVCPEKYFKRMGKGHQRADVKTEWVRVQNSIAQFRSATQWIREKGDKKINKALDDCEGSMMKYFEKYVRGAYAVEANKEVYAEVMPMAIDVLCMEYVSAGKNNK